MSTSDLINGFFESLGGLFILRSIVLLHRSKKVQGISALHVTFFTAWGGWNLFYYPHLGQWLSFWGGLGVTLTNIVWLGQIAFYLRRSKRTPQDFSEMTLQHLRNLVDWAETLLCNSLPMSHCSQEQWDGFIRSWRDRKHGSVCSPEPKRCTRNPGHSGPCNGYCCHSQN